MHKTKIAIMLLMIALLYGCNANQENSSAPVANQSDENYTGVKKFYEGEVLKKEVTYKNGIKEGLNKNYYDDGRLKRTIWYENNIKEDTAKWYYAEGTVYRATPYKNNKIHGVQTKFYKNGRVLAKIPYKHGLRTPGLVEYYDNGLEVGNIPTINTLKIGTEDYKEDGVVTVVLVLSNKSKNVKYFYGNLVDGAFDETKCKDVTAATGMSYIELFRSESGGKGYIDVIAVYTTRFRNKEIITRRVKLPYNDLK